MSNEAIYNIGRISDSNLWSAIHNVYFILYLYALVIL